MHSPFVWNQPSLWRFFWPSRYDLSRAQWQSHCCMKFRMAWPEHWQIPPQPLKIKITRQNVRKRKHVIHPERSSIFCHEGSDILQVSHKCGWEAEPDLRQREPWSSWRSCAHWHRDRIHSRPQRGRWGCNLWRGLESQQPVDKRQQQETVTDAELWKILKRKMSCMHMAPQEGFSCQPLEKNHYDNTARFNWNHFA